MKNMKKKFSTILLSILILNFCSILFLTRSSLLINSYYPIGGNELKINSYYYSNWDQNITVGMDGSLLIAEKMTFRLSAGSYGYAYRNLKWRNFNDVSSWSITADSGTPAVNYYRMDKEIQYIIFYWEWTRISVPDDTSFSFILTYNVSSAMDLRGNRDRVYWNVIGGEFEVPIYNISTIAFFPKEYNISDVRSTTYYIGKDPGDDEGIVTNMGGKTIVTYHQDFVGAYESYTIDTDSPPAGIDMPFSMRVYINSSWLIPILIGFIPIFLFFILIFLIKGLDPRVRVIPTLNEIAVKKCAQCGYRDLKSVQFCPQCGNPLKVISEVGPPNDMTPAEVGTLLDEKFDKIDFVAEFFYLAEQGYLRIIQQEESEEIYFQRTQKERQYGNLSLFDKALLNFIENNSYDQALYKEGKGKKSKEFLVEVTSLTTIKTNVDTLWKFKTDVYKKLSGGDTKYFESNPEKIKNSYKSLSIALGIIGSIAFYGLAVLLYVYNLQYAIIGVIVASVIGLILSKKMPKMTKHGAKMEASWYSYLQLLRGQITGFPDPYEQFNFSMDHFSYLLIDPKFNLPNHLKRITKQITQRPPPDNYMYIAPFWYFHPGIYMPGGLPMDRTISGADNLGKGFETMVQGISKIAESLPAAISNLAEGLTQAISTMSNSFTPSSSSGGFSDFGGGFGGGGGGGGGGGIG